MDTKGSPEQEGQQGEVKERADRIFNDFTRCKFKPTAPVLKAGYPGAPHYICVWCFLVQFVRNVAGQVSFLFMLSTCIFMYLIYIPSTHGEW